MSAAGCRPPHTAGRSGEPNRAHVVSAVRWGQRAPAGLPWGRAGNDGEIDGAMQHAPQPGRHASMPYHTAGWGGRVASRCDARVPQVREPAGASGRIGGCTSA